jgi:hypothetical protein
MTTRSVPSRLLELWIIFAEGWNTTVFPTSTAISPRETQSDLLGPGGFGSDNLIRDEFGIGVLVKADNVPIA